VYGEKIEAFFDGKNDLAPPIIDYKNLTRNWAKAFPIIQGKFIPI